MSTPSSVLAAPGKQGKGGVSNWGGAANDDATESTGARGNARMRRRKKALFTKRRSSAKTTVLQPPHRDAGGGGGGAPSVTPGRPKSGGNTCSGVDLASGAALIGRRVEIWWDGKKISPFSLFLESSLVF